MMNADPIVVGGGIGGLTVALALARRGVGVTVVEQRTVLTEPGAGIQLSPNASRVLMDLGLGSAVGRRAVEPEQLTVHAMGSGRQLAAMPLGRAMRNRHGAPYWVVLRSDLHTVLLDAARSTPHIRLRIGRKAVDIHEGPLGAAVSVTGDRGQETLDTPLVIGADGLWSRVRETIAPAIPEFRGYIAWRATLPITDVPTELRGKQSRLWLGRDAHVVHYPVAGGRELNVVAIIASKTTIDGNAKPGDPAELKRRMRGCDSNLRKLIEAVPRWLLWPLHDLPPLPRWSHGNAVLIGDAAHPVLPFLAQGGALAIEDAAILAQLVVPEPGEMAVTSSTLATFEDIRKARAARVQNEARRNGSIYHMRWPLALARNVAMKRLGAEGFLARYDWLYGWTPQ
ncbi:FAD-dependent monooxygenase [Chelatococcus sp. HY11]|uniref:FAD-dependent monooxygenase n=2 Tax=unclassified Chelatococcus TaxID=2638111 RepID=UPI001BD0A8BF|nr:FAD-dependent monooxygenase [Chelatococcus sp. HY11]MBS7738093.1 FAD-dependent oxidoreductase [Chelatococcus sp. HY11]MBX3546960.1 FAD-dependent oxidoreductase [Chelatococcus sp.]CAH1668572.1 Salicylate hydroxylase [Hyphomicrobiales bacterium]CAH1679199.1 Salicylate hydroxylase [Hyphomicrobiales bacterium]